MNLYEWPNPVAESAQRLQNQINSVQRAVNYHNESIRQINQYLSNISEFYRSNINWAQKFHEYNNEFYRNIHDQLRRFGEISQRFSTIMVELGWPPNHRLVSTEIRRIVEAYDEFGIEEIKAEVDEYFVRRFDEEKLEELFEFWKSRDWLNLRVPIIREALNAHYNSNYFAAISTLLPQIEGVIADGFGHVGQMHGGLLKKYLKKLLNDTDNYSFDEAIQKYYLDIILAGFEHGTVPKSFLSRHAILHGGDTNYGNITNSLKSILLFDYLQDKFRLLSIGNGNCYHLIGCSVVQRNRQLDWVLYNNKTEAEMDGKRACKLCHP